MTFQPRIVQCHCSICNGEGDSVQKLPREHPCSIPKPCDPGLRASNHGGYRSSTRPSLPESCAKQRQAHDRPEQEGQGNPKLSRKLVIMTYKSQPSNISSKSHDTTALDDWVCEIKERDLGKDHAHGA